MKAGIRTINVNFTVLDSDERIHNYSIYWKKECGSGRYSGREERRGQRYHDRVSSINICLQQVSVLDLRSWPALRDLKMMR